MRYATLISAADLAAHLDAPDWVICDCRHALNDPEAGRQSYREGHIPGARFVHLDEDMAGPLSGKNGRHPLPAPEAFAETLGRLGITPDQQVIAYDDGSATFAARWWWMLRWIGHEAVAVLDGGWTQWVNENRPVTTVPPRHEASQYPVGPRDDLWVNVDFVSGHLHQDSMTLVDARSPDRFAGQNETLDPVGGHIPGAHNRFFRDNLEVSGRFKPASQLREEFSALMGTGSPHQVVHQCGSGVTACNNLLAMEIAGLSGSRLYPGSWSEWCADPSRPIAGDTT